MTNRPFSPLAPGDDQSAATVPGWLDGAVPDLGVVAPQTLSRLAASTTQYPYDNVVYITDFINGVEYQGSGVLIAPDEVLTASHVLWSTQYGAATGIEVSPGFNAGAAPFGTVSAENIHYNEVQDGNDQITLQQSQFDYAVIHLSSSFNLGHYDLYSNFGGGVVNVTGYPGQLNGAQDDNTQTVSQDPYWTLLDGTTLGKGSSGGPVWINGNAGPQVVGVVSSGVAGPGSAGYFCQITNADYNQIEAWVRQDDGATTGAHATSDFNGDGTSDILFQNTNSGLLLDWRAQNGGYSQSLPIGTPGAGWLYQATGDFNGDATTDILFRNSQSGLLLYWRMAGGTYQTAVPIAGTTPDWQVVGTGDFNNDGSADILFRNSNSGLFLDWQMSGGYFAQATPIAEAAPGWQFLGTGDFNGDGTSDLLFQNTSSGLLLYWQMNDGAYSQAVPLAAATPDWKFLGTGDFTGTGADGILFQNTNSGLLLDWQLNNGQFEQAIPIAATTPDWQFAGTGDYNGDGTTDILFRNTSSGLLLDWRLAGGQYGGDIPIAGAGADWKVV